MELNDCWQMEDSNTMSPLERDFAIEQTCSLIFNMVEKAKLPLDGGGEISCSPCTKFVVG